MSAYSTSKISDLFMGEWIKPRNYNMCNVSKHTYVHTQPHCQLSHSSLSTSQPSRASSKHLSYLLFTLQFISRWTLTFFMCFFLNKDRGIKSPVPWKEFIPCQIISLREQQEHYHSQVFICQSTLGLLVVYCIKNAMGWSPAAAEQMGI